MKLCEILYFLGLRPKLRTYGCVVKALNLPIDGRIEYAQWLHPRTCKDPDPAEFQDSVTELRRFIRRGDVAVDIGAHSGDTTLPIALATGAEGCVLALEPNPHVFSVLSRNAQLNLDKTHIVPLEFAATQSDGDIVFEYSDPGFCNGGRHPGISRWRHGHAFPLTVQGRNLGKYLREHHSDLLTKLRYIKIDAEGYDLAILRTLDDIITDYAPYIKAEVFKHTDRSQREDMLGFLHQHDYAVYHVENESCYSGEPIEIEDAMRWRHFDVFCVPKKTGRNSIS